jgi:tetratricopeptide (TPR) repeat protein
MTVRLQRAHLLLRQSRPDEAVTELRSELAVDPDSAEALSLLAICLAMREAWDEATAAAGRAIGVAPDWAFPHYAMARVLEDRGQLDGSEQAIAEAIRLDPRHAGFFVTLARIRLEKGNWTEALAAAEHAQNLDPEDTGAANLRAMALVKLGRKADARSALGSTLAREPDNALTHANQGWALLHAGESRRALTHFQEALRIDPTLDWARQGLVEALKARNPAYRLLLRYFLWMSRLSPRASWAVLLGAYVVFRFLGPFWWVYLLLVLVTWTAEPLSNLMLRLSRYGRLLLSREEVVASNWLGATLAVAVGCALAGLVTGSSGLGLGGIAVAVLAIPLAAVFNCEPGWPRRTMAAYTAGCAAVIALGIAVSVAGDGQASPLTVVGAVAAAVGSWLGNFLAGRRVRH